jgi:putative membrane protein
MWLILRWLVLALAVAIAARLVPGIDVEGGALGTLWVAALLGLVNAVIGPVLRLLALPLTILTLGLFAVLINAALLGIVAWLSDHLQIDGFWPAVLAALVISLISALLGFFVSGRRHHA